MPVVVSLGRDVAIRAACADAAAQLPTHPYKFMRVATLPDAGGGAHVDVLAVVTSLSSPVEYNRRSDGRPGLKRLLEVCDNSAGDGAPCGVRVTLFVKENESLDVAVGTIVALRGTVELWSGTTSLTAGQDGLVCDPKIPEAAQLATWWRTQLAAPKLLAPRWSFVGLDALPGKPVGDRVDVVGVVLAWEVRASKRSALPPPTPGHRSPASLAVDEWQTPINYTRQSDGCDATRQVVDVTDASKKRVRVTIFMKGEERLELVVGKAVALRATTELLQQRVALKAFYDGVTCGGVAEAEALAEDFRREPWDAAPMEPRMNVVSLPTLLDKTAGERVDVRGVVTRLEVRHTARTIWTPHSASQCL